MKGSNSSAQDFAVDAKPWAELLRKAGRNLDGRFRPFKVGRLFLILTELVFALQRCLHEPFKQRMRSVGSGF